MSFSLSPVQHVGALGHFEYLFLYKNTVNFQLKRGQNYYKVLVLQKHVSDLKKRDTVDPRHSLYNSFICFIL